MEKILKEFSPIPPFPLESIKLSNPKYSDSFGNFKFSRSEYFFVYPRASKTSGPLFYSTKAWKRIIYLPFFLPELAPSKSLSFIDNHRKFRGLLGRNIFLYILCASCVFDEFTFQSKSREVSLFEVYLSAVFLLWRRLLL